MYKKQQPTTSDQKGLTAASEQTAPSPKASPPRDTSNAASIEDKGLVEQEGGSGVLQSLRKDLGGVKDIPGANSVMGRALDSVDVGDDQAVEGELSLEIELMGAEVGFDIDFSLEKAGRNLELAAGFCLAAGREVDLGFFEVEGGLYVAGQVDAKGDSGEELMRLLSLAMLPHVRGVSPTLADRLYGGAEAFEKVVLDGLDRDDPATETDDAEADSVTSSLEAGGYLGAEVDIGKDLEGKTNIKAGYRSETTLSKGADGSLHADESSGMAFTFELEAGGLDWALEYFDGKFEVSTSAKPPPGTNAVLAQYVVGVVQSVPNLVTLIRTELARKGDPTKARQGLDAAWALLRNKMTAVTTMVIEAQLPESTAAELGFELVLGGRDSSFAITASQVLEGDAEVDVGAGEVEVEGKLASTQTLFKIP